MSENVSPERKAAQDEVSAAVEGSIEFYSALNKVVDAEKAEALAGDSTLADLESWFKGLSDNEKVLASANLLAIIVAEMPTNSRDLSVVKTNAETAYLWAKQALLKTK